MLLLCVGVVIPPKQFCKRRRMYLLQHLSIYLCCFTNDMPDIDYNFSNKILKKKTYNFWLDLKPYVIFFSNI